MVRFSWEELGRTVGAPLTNVVLNRAGLGLDAMCSLYRALPYRVMPFPFTTPFTRLLRGTWDSLCAPRGALPPPPTSPFTGGQCPVNYNITYRRAFTQRSTGTQVDQTVQFGNPVLGPIGQTLVIEGVNLVLKAINGSGQLITINTINRETNDITFFGITNVSRVGGGLDNCGNPPPQYPPRDPANYSTNITQNFNDGGSVTVPLVFAPVTVVANVTPTFTVQIDGVNFNFDFGGVDIDIGGGSSGGGFTSSDRNTINNINTEITNISNGSTQVNCDDSDVLAAIASFRSFTEGRFNSIEQSLECIEALIRYNSPNVIIPGEGRSIITQLTATFSENVFYVELDRAGIAYVGIELIEPVPDNVRVYKMDSFPSHAEYGAGNVSLTKFVVDDYSLPGITHLFTLFTLIDIPGEDDEGFLLRISLKPGVSVIVWDLGYSWERENPPTCEQLTG